MNIERYEYRVRPDYFDFEFISTGPKGSIKKIARFTLIKSNSIPFYNLSFGDWNEIKVAIDDENVTNNNDTEKVLATVAAIVIDFSNHFPDAIIYAEGSTLARTRRYQMGIAKFWNEIKLIFKVFGIKSDGSMEPYRKNVNYIAFWAQRI